jgi:uncharacterized protein (DUF433 family)
VIFPEKHAVGKGKAASATLCYADGAAAPAPRDVALSKEESAVKGLMPMSEQPRIEVNPKVMLGKPVIHGTRITVELILRKLGEGSTLADLMEAYPHLTVEDIQAAITYAADTVAHEETVLVERNG